MSKRAHWFSAAPRVSRQAFAWEHRSNKGRQSEFRQVWSSLWLFFASSSWADVVGLAKNCEAGALKCLECVAIRSFWIFLVVVFRFFLFVITSNRPSNQFHLRSDIDMSIWSFYFPGLCGRLRMNGFRFWHKVPCNKSSSDIDIVQRPLKHTKTSSHLMTKPAIHSQSLPCLPCLLCSGQDFLHRAMTELLQPLGTTPGSPAGGPLHPGHGLLVAMAGLSFIRSQGPKKWRESQKVIVFFFFQFSDRFEDEIQTFRFFDAFLVSFLEANWTLSLFKRIGLGALLVIQRSGLVASSIPGSTRILRQNTTSTKAALWRPSLKS